MKRGYIWLLTILILAIVIVDVFVILYVRENNKSVLWSSGNYYLPKDYKNFQGHTFKSADSQVFGITDAKKGAADCEGYCGEMRGIVKDSFCGVSNGVPTLYACTCQFSDSVKNNTWEKESHDVKSCSLKSCNADTDCAHIPTTILNSVCFNNHCYEGTR